MSDLKKGESLVIFLAVGFVLFALIALGAALYECIKVHSSRITKHKVKRQWKKRQLSLCNPRPENLQRPTEVSARVSFQSDNLTTVYNTDDQDVNVIANNNVTLPPSNDETLEMQVLFETDAESAEM